jgi:protein TorT
MIASISVAADKAAVFPEIFSENGTLVDWDAPIPNKKYLIGVIIPHLDDSYWQTVSDGLERHAKRLGVSVKIFSAGGYTNIGMQRDLLGKIAASDMFDGLILASVMTDGVDRFLKKVVKSGKPIVGLINDIESKLINSTVGYNFETPGYLAGKYLFGSDETKLLKIAILAGPKKSSWSTKMYNGFMKSVEEARDKGRQVEIIGPIFGDTRHRVQRKRVVFINKLIADDSLDYIVGNAVAAKQAYEVLKKNHDTQSRAKLISFYMTNDIYSVMKNDGIEAACYDYPDIASEIALDLMVKELNGEVPGVDFPNRLELGYVLIKKDDVKNLEYRDFLEP